MLNLLGRGLRVAAVASVLATPVTAHAFCRTTTASVPPNYNASGHGCYTDGLLLFWRNACVGYSVQNNGSQGIPYGEAKRVIDLSFSTWMQAICTDSGAPVGISVSDLGPAECREVRYNPEGANQNLIVFLDDGWPYNDANNTLGLTTVTFNADTGEIYDADMEINATGRNLSTTDQVPANGFDLQSVITHEAGHFLGLAHATDSKATMFAAYKPGTTALRTLTPDDVDGVCAIYPNTTTRTVSASVSASQTVPADACNATPRHGLASACAEAADEKSKDSCAAAPKLGAARSRWGAFATVAFVFSGVLAARRRRARRA
jgi:hypothetical protein